MYNCILIFSYSVIPADDTYEDLIGVEDDEEVQLDEDEDEDDDMVDLKACVNAQPLWVLPLYSLLPSHKQARVIEKFREQFRQLK